MKRLFALFLLVVFAACSGDNGISPRDDDNDDGGGGGTVTSEDSLIVQELETFVTQFEQWAGLEPDTIAARSVRYLDALPNVANVGITEGTTTVWANFNNGFSFLIPNNREPSTPADTLVDAQSVVPRSAARPQTGAKHITIPAGRGMMRALRVPEKGREIPDVPRFRAVNAIGSCHIDPLPGIRALLTAGHYANTYPGAPTVANLKNVNGDGIFYINSHGGPGFDKQGNPYYAIWTLDPLNVATLANYSGMVGRRELVGMLQYSNNAQGACACVMHYGFTSAFVTAYMSFAKNSLVIVDACSSASGPAGALQQAFKGKGASVYVGWTNSVGAGHAYAAMKYLLDRILGLNVISPEDPEQRAFNIYDVRDDMAAHTSLLTDPQTGAVLTVVALKDDFGLLTPSIQFLSLEDDGQQPRLLIAGVFGSDPGEDKRSVTINGQELQNIDWYSTEIDCDIPETGSNASGTVVVTVGTGATARKSNPVNITEWIGELTYDRDDPGEMAAQMKIKVRILADIHSFRDFPGEPPFETTVLFIPRGDTNIHMTTSGKYEEVIASCKDTYNFGQGGDIGTPFGTGNGKDGSWTYFGSVDTQSHTLQLNVGVVGVFNAGSYVRTRIGPDDCDPFNLPLYVTMAIDNCLYDDIVQAPAFRMQMQDDFTVPADDRGPCDAQPLIGELDGLKGQARIKWNQMTPLFLPDPDAAR
jgi:hypothetical protein